MTSLFPISADWRAWSVYTVLVVALSFVLFGDLRHHPLGVDDDSMFRDNVATSADFSYFFRPPEEKELGSGRPLAELVKWLAHLVWGQDRGAFHLLVVVLHTAASLLLAAAAARLHANTEVAFAGGLLFLTNTAHFSAVHWISAMDYALALLWLLAAVVAHLEHLRSSKTRWAIAAHLSLVLGLMSHLAAVAAVPVCFYLSQTVGEQRGRPVRHTLPLLATSVVAGALLLGLTAKYTTTWSAIDAEHGDASAMLRQLVTTLCWLAGRLLSTAHWLPVPVHERQTWELWLGAVSLAVMSWLAWKRSHSAGIWPVLTIFSLLLFVPAALVHTGISRYLYLASAGSSMLLAWLLQLGCRRLPRAAAGRALFAASMALILASSYASLKQAEFISLYRSGRFYYNAGQDRQAAMLLRRALDGGKAVIPGETAYVRMVGANLRSGAEYAAALREALEAFPENLILRAMLAATQYSSQDPAVRSLGEVLSAELEETAQDRGRFVYTMGVVYHNLGVRFGKLERHERAAWAFERALSFDPERLGSSKDLARALYNSGQYASSAEAAMSVALRMPSSSEFLHIAAAALHMQGEPARALEVCNLGLKTQPTRRLYLLSAEIHEELGDIGAAEEARRKAARLTQ